MGVQKLLTKQGSGSMPAAGQVVTVHCIGYQEIRGRLEAFWSTKDGGGRSFKFKSGQEQAIKDWDKYVSGMRVGECARLTFSPDYAYGELGFPVWDILPNSTLIFDVEVLSAQ